LIADKHRRVDDQRAELLHDVERQRGPAVPRLVVEAEVGVEADGQELDGHVLGQERVAEGQERVHRVARRPAVPPVEVEATSARAASPSLAGGRTSRAYSPK
jgi:hypothetical protein